MTELEQLLPPEVALYHSFGGQRAGGYRLVGHFTVDETTGQAVLSVTDETVRTKLEEFAAGLASNVLRRTVGTDEGELFLSTLVATFRQSSHWRPLERRRIGRRLALPAELMPDPRRAE